MKKELEIWRKRGPVGKLHNVVKYIFGSPQRRGAFKAISAYDESFESSWNTLQLVSDNATRWNSLYSMIERALKLRQRIDLFCFEHKDAVHGKSMKERATNADQDALLSKDILTSDDWSALAEALAILKPFYDLTKRAEGTKLTADRGTISDYMVTLNKIVAHVRIVREDLMARNSQEEFATDATSFLLACSNNCWYKIDEYFLKSISIPAVYASVATNPKMKYKYFQHSWRNASSWIEAVEPEKWVDQALNAIQEVWEEYQYLPLPQESSTGGKRQAPPDDFELDSDMTILYGDDDNEEINRAFDNWISSKPERYDADGTSLPLFWKRHLNTRTSYRLAKMGLDMASIPAMSSDCERVFSQCKLLITGQRNKLQPDIIEASQCLRMWKIMERRKEGKWAGRGNWVTPTEIAG